MAFQSNNSDQLRRSELAKIHIAKNDLGLDEDSYRDILWTICRVKSSADLDSKGRFKLLHHFKHLGWKPKKGKASADRKGGKIRSLWIQLREAGKIMDSSENALRTEIEKLTGCSDIRFCTEAQKSHVIECLKAWLNRAA